MKYLTIFIVTIILASCYKQGNITPAINKPQSQSQNCLSSFQYKEIVVPPSELQRIAQKIYQNECGGKYENLATWNIGEDFPSLGIGHFIWFPRNANVPFTETFPNLIRYMQQKGEQIPDWLTALNDAPWTSYTDFQNQSNSQLTQRLRAFLARTMSLQMAFIVDRLNQSFPTIVCTAEPALRERIWNNFYAVAQTTGGIYPLVDYINFKGEGSSEKERYNGQGWGLLQVLTEMNPQMNPRTAFAKAAEMVLERRVRNAPAEKNENRWLPGWKNRLGTYLQ